MKKPTTDEERREFFQRIGKKGGLIAAGAGGRATLETMTKAARISRAYQAGKRGGAPVRINHQKVLELRAAGKVGREIAAELGISEPSVWRILRSAK